MGARTLLRVQLPQIQDSPQFVRLSISGDFLLSLINPRTNLLTRYIARVTIIWKI